MNKAYVIMDTWKYNLWRYDPSKYDPNEDEESRFHSTLISELGVYRDKEEALKSLLEYLDLYEPLEEFKRVVSENIVMEIYGDKIDTVYQIKSIRLDNGKGSTYSINELFLHV